MQFPVTLHFDTGKILHGVSQDVSLAGFFINLQPGITLENALTGTGTIQLGAEKYTFNCRLTRQTRAGIGISILKESPLLGYAITTHIFNEISSHHLR